MPASRTASRSGGGLAWALSCRARLVARARVGRIRVVRLLSLSFLRFVVGCSRGLARVEDRLHERLLCQVRRAREGLVRREREQPGEFGSTQTA